MTTTDTAVKKDYKIDPTQTDGHFEEVKILFSFWSENLTSIQILGN